MLCVRETVPRARPPAVEEVGGEGGMEPPAQLIAEAGEGVRQRVVRGGDPTGIERYVVEVEEPPGFAQFLEQSGRPGRPGGEHGHHRLVVLV